MLKSEEFYDGTAWTEVNDLNTARQFNRFRCGTQTASVVAGGYTPTLQENRRMEWFILDRKK